MLQIVYGRNSTHPLIIAVVSKLADVYEDQGRQDEATAVRDRNRKIDEASDDQVLNRTIGN